MIGIVVKLLLLSPAAERSRGRRDSANPDPRPQARPFRTGFLFCHPRFEQIA